MCSQSEAGPRNSLPLPLPCFFFWRRTKSTPNKPVFLAIWLYFGLRDPLFLFVISLSLSSPPPSLSFLENRTASVPGSAVGCSGAKP